MPTPLSAHFDGFEPVLSTEAMRAADRRTMEEFGLSGFVLMETAGREATRVIEEHFGQMAGRSVLVLAGRGNNGGDGLVVARALHARGARVRVVTLASDDQATDETARNLRLLRAIADHDAQLAVDAFEGFGQIEGARADLVVDALLGIGVTGALREPVRSLARWVNAQPAPVAAMDVPTGLNSDTGEAAEDAVRAALTVAMGALKPGLLFGAGPEHAGEVVAVDIGLPPHLVREAVRMEGSALRITDTAVAALLPRRARDAHKYTAGRVLAVAGSLAFPGAAVMASQAAARAGAGAVVCCTPERARPLVAAQLTEVMTAPVPDTAEGTFAEAALDALLERAGAADAVLVGCGIGKNAETQRLVRRLLPQLGGPVVVDADGLNALAGNTEILTEHAAGRWVLTPHLGELRRLAGTDDLPTHDRIRLAAAYAKRWNAVLVVKGMPSVIAAPDGRAFVAGAGNAALATAGTGDVLAGMTAGLLAQGLAPAEAAVCALHLGGRAADRYAAAHAPRTLLATDLLRYIR